MWSVNDSSSSACCAAATSALNPQPLSHSCGPRAPCSSPTATAGASQVAIKLTLETTCSIMPRETRSCVVYWTHEKKAGIEPLNNVPSNARFEGSMTSVMFSGDKRWYPAKIVMISDDIAALNAKEEEIAQSILEETQRQAAPSTRTRPSKKKKERVVPNVATERQIASALGTKPPVPKNLTSEDTAIRQAKKQSKLNSRSGQDQLDNKVVNKIKVNLFQSSSTKGKQDDDDDDDDDDDYDVTSDDAEEIDSTPQNHDLDVDHSNNEKESSSKGKWCDCTPCLTLEKYDNPTYLCLLKDVIKLIEERDEDSSSKQRYLKLKPIPEGVRQVELTIGSGIHISRPVKDQLKVDFRNKASSLIRETLYALYGKEPFQTLTITGRGNKPGTYGIEESVLTALTGFINRHVEPGKRMTLSNVVNTINKRAIDWRAKTPSPKPDTKFKRKRSATSKVVSTSPFKAVKLTTSKRQDDLSDVTSPIRTSPVKITPSPMKRIISPTKKTHTPTKNIGATTSSSMKQPSPRKSPASKKPSPLKMVSPPPSTNVNPSSSMASCGPQYYNYPQYNHYPASYPTNPHPPSSQQDLPHYNYWSNPNEYPSWQGWNAPQESEQPTFTVM
ncbi:putative DNA-directed RNA polymerase subunit delta [Frankliniella fusca]|uniref:DNA-directed RNA polymerase subunit delta n=1 Tax=Frankliniella fusca TaxID=407009 RepID=A0AAE1LE10_9NEOP|nr:putative DNA-directed RNA polymerase subunit delta [Frankliniella fusca]